MIGFFVVAFGFIAAIFLMHIYEKNTLEDFTKPPSEFENREIQIEDGIWVNSQQQGVEEAIVSTLKVFRCLPAEFAHENFYSSKPLIVTVLDGAIELFLSQQGERRSHAYDMYVSFLLSGTFVSKDSDGNVVYYNSAAVDVFREAAAINRDTKSILIKCLLEKKEVFDKVFPDMSAVTSFLEDLTCKEDDMAACEALAEIYLTGDSVTVNIEKSKYYRLKAEEIKKRT